jgi:hypothetical protein
MSGKGRAFTYSPTSRVALECARTGQRDLGGGVPRPPLLGCRAASVGRQDTDCAPAGPQRRQSQTRHPRCRHISCRPKTTTALCFRHKFCSHSALDFCGPNRYIPHLCLRPLSHRFYILAPVPSLRSICARAASSRPSGFTADCVPSKQPQRRCLRRTRQPVPRKHCVGHHAAAVTNVRVDYTLHQYTT